VSDKPHIISVLLADDHPIVRDGVRQLLERADDIEVIAEASDGQEALDLVFELNPDVLLLDMEMPIVTGIEVARQLASRESKVRILALSAYDDEEYIFGVLDAGAAGYLTKDEAPETIVDAVRGVATGDEGWISRRAADRIVARRKRIFEQVATHLSDREREILRHLAKGMGNSEISEILFISEGTVKNHVSHIYEKLGLRTRAEAVAWAWQHDIMNDAHGH
jgi:RNA polymerase sigma factor (sigma-70 family)